MLGKSVEGRDMTLLTFGEAAESKLSVWVTARQHPGETMAEWFAEVFGKHFYVEIQNNGLDIQKLCAEGFSLEVYRRVGKALGNWDAALAKQLPLPLLGGGVIDLKDAELREGVSIGEGIKARAEQYILTDTGADETEEMVFRVTAAGDDKSAEGDRIGAINTKGRQSSTTARPCSL